MTREQLIELLESLTETVRDMQGEIDPQDTTTPGCVSRGEELVKKLRAEGCPQLMEPKDLKAHERHEALKLAGKIVRKTEGVVPEIKETIEKALAEPEFLEDALGAHFSVFNGHINDADERAYQVLRAVCPPAPLKLIEKLREDGIMAIFNDAPPTNWVPAYVALVFAFVNENRAAPHFAEEQEDEDGEQD